jgi:hypothetical protein
MSQTGVLHDYYYADCCFIVAVVVEAKFVVEMIRLKIYALMKEESYLMASCDSFLINN